MQTEEPLTIVGDVTAAAERLASAREHRAAQRQSVRAVIDQLEAEAKRRLGTVFAHDDPITGRPTCLLVKSNDRLDDAYEAQTPRAIPDSQNRLTIEILGRVLAIEIDDFGHARVEGVSGTSDLNRVDLHDGDAIFHAGASATHPTSFASLLVRLIDSAYNDELAAARVVPDEPET